MKKKRLTRRQILEEFTRPIRIVPYIAPSNMWELPSFKEKMRIAEEVLKRTGLPKP